MSSKTIVVLFCAIGAIAACAAGTENGVTTVEHERTEAPIPPSSRADAAATPSTDASESEASAADAAADVQIDAEIDAGPTGLALGSVCAQPADCASGLCKNGLPGSGSSICVTACTSQNDCPGNYYCAPETPGASAGFCVPRSPSHCKTCANDGECGGISEKCGTAAGDIVKACHVDCTLSGAAACPADYSCVATTLDGISAKVCRPNANLSCLDALGGFCDRVATPQTCARSNVAGMCVGQRACLAGSLRYNSCGAPAPMCKMTCSATDPAGCTTSFCAEATDTPDHCGACGNVCPGYLKPNVNVACNQPTCTFSCKGESYDVDDNKATGCEATDPKTGNHTSNTATSLGDIACYDGSSNPDIAGRLPSDSQAHASPAIAGFVSATGSAPDYYEIHATGQSSAFNPCVNNIDLTLKMTGSSHPTCYHLRVETNKNTYDCDTNASGTCRIEPGGSSLYDDDTDIVVVVSKRNVAGCGATARDNPSYTVTGHL